jgi:hypothetical protein
MTQKPHIRPLKALIHGTASISIRQNVAKIDFYQALPIMDKDGADEQREFRKVSHRLVLPVTGLADIINSVKQLQSQSPIIKRAIKNNKLEVIGANYSLKSGAVITSSLLFLIALLIIGDWLCSCLTELIMLVSTALCERWETLRNSLCSSAPSLSMIGKA